jgi:hypothetical protein
MNKLISILTLALLVVAPGCIMVGHEHHDCLGDECYQENPGDIQFDWAFELYDTSSTSSCAVAEVARIEVNVYDSYGALEYTTTPNRPCEDLGATITNFSSGFYTLEMIGICPSGIETHQGSWDIEVYSGQLNDFGTLTLAYLGPCD